ncbi:tricarballylate utilization 4Fe-4S protein TcuB [Aquabacter spiritensis]|uniref:Citrate/tricarballylate utilization protein n=1 Tax=Aquabacter spiritensis TaxID=933073 RepID=A0A4V2UXV8_9HYPH|nr:tricarballylate utilization 4Fe-4S protein TcuB [Aquabacter spiritensis]TCT05008.1 citrate/tricarballylate utilization protein [Aquabacter spiritensis]
MSAHSEALREAERLMTVCNSCRYCEGLCAVFPAMEMRRAFSAGDLNYLANLCHSCGACYYDCQFSPPHEFDVNVPRTLAIVRNDSYADYAWPRALSGTFKRNGLAVSLIAVLSVVAFLFAFMALSDPSVMFARQVGEGAFYRIMPHDAMVALFGGVFLYSCLALFMGLRAFWRDMAAGPPPAFDLASLWQAMKDAGRLRYLDGGGVGCMNADERPRDTRRLYHHMTFYGFGLCFAATSVATLYAYLLGRAAPYPWWDLPVVLGTLGGIGLLIGPAGLLLAKSKRDPVLMDGTRTGMDAAFLAMLFFTALTGLALLVLRATPAMGTLLAVHLGFVFGFFLTMPYGKFVHGLYRYAALVRYAMERRAEEAAAEAAAAGGAAKAAA